MEKLSKSIDNFHKCMRKDPFLIGLCTAFDISLEELEQYIREIGKELDVDKATWGLNLFERDTDLRKNRSLDFETRRSAIKAKWRTTGKADLELLQQVVDAWGTGVIVDFKQDGYIHLTFKNIFDEPEDFPTLLESLDEVKPAHLAIWCSYLRPLVKIVHSTRNTRLNKIKVKNFGFSLIIRYLQIRNIRQIHELLVRDFGFYLLVGKVDGLVIDHLQDIKIEQFKFK